MKKTILFIIILFVACKEKEVEKKAEPYTSGYIELPAIKYHFDQKTDSLLKSIGIEDISKIKRSDVSIFIRAIDKGYFSKKSFCQFYKEYKTYEFKGDLKASDKVIKPLENEIVLTTIMGAFGNELCPTSLIEAKSFNSKYKSVDNYKSAKLNPCIISKDFIKKDLYKPSTANFSTFDCSSEQNSDASYTVLRKVSAKNALGVEKEFIYKVRFGFLGGNEVDILNWKLISIQSEEYN